MDTLTPRQTGAARPNRTLLILLCCCGLFLFLTMPDHITPGDCYASRAEAAHLVMTGELGIDFANKPELSWFVDKRGGYFFENDAKQKLFNKWGIMNTILYLPPMLATKLFAGRVEMVDRSTTHLFFVNCNNVLLSLLIIFYLYRIISLYSDREWQRLLFVLLSVFTTYLWFFLRAQMHEIFQISMAVGFYYHFLVFLRAAAEEDAQKKWPHLLLAMGWAGLLLLTKVLYITIIAIAWLFACLAGPAERPLLARVRQNLLGESKNLGRCLLLPTLLFIAIFLSVNYYKTGSSLETGYGQEQFDEVDEISFSPRVLLESVPGFLFQKGNANVFLHYPLLLLAMFGLKSFCRKRPSEAGFILFTVLANFLVIACYQTWRGEWGDGPRYLVIFAILGSLPAIEAITALSRAIQTRQAQAATVLCTGVALWSLLMQVNENSVENFAFYYHEGFFEQFDEPEINDYFTGYLTRGTFYGDLLAYKYLGRPYTPIEVLRRKRPDWYAANGQRLHETMRAEIRQNYLFVRLLNQLRQTGSLSAGPPGSAG